MSPDRLIPHAHPRPRPAALLATIALLATAVATTACNGNGDDAAPAEQAAPQTGPAAAEQADDAPVVPPPEPQRVAMTAGRATLSAQAPLAIEHLLPREYASKLIHGQFDVEPLPGQKPGPNYNALQLRPATKDPRYGIGLQVWKLNDQTAATARIAELKEQYLGTSDLHDTAAKKTGFRSERAGIRTYLFAADSSPHVIALSCATQVCTTWSMVYKLGSDVEAKL